MTVMTQRVQEVSAKTRALATRLNLYYAAVAVLMLLNLYLLIHIVFAWRTATSQDETALAQQRVAMKTAEIAKKPLEGLDAKLEKATEQADAFYAKRLPFAYSQVAGELGSLAKKQGVKLSRVQYAQAPVLAGSKGELTEVRMDASLNGDYKGLVLFVNSLERDKMFFLISNMTLTGQQSGSVGLRLRVITYLRAPVGKEVSEKIVADAAAADAAPKGGASR